MNGNVYSRFREKYILLRGRRTFNPSKRSVFVKVYILKSNQF